jgi:hypothetical protein
MDSVARATIAGRKINLSRLGESPRTEVGTQTITQMACNHVGSRYLGSTMSSH